jgi:hypothetical protein
MINLSEIKNMDYAFFSGRTLFPKLIRIWSAGLKARNDLTIPNHVAYLLKIDLLKESLVRNRYPYTEWKDNGVEWIVNGYDHIDRDRLTCYNPMPLNVLMGNLIATKRNPVYQNEYILKNAIIRENIRLGESVIYDVFGIIKYAIPFAKEFTNAFYCSERVARDMWDDSNGAQWVSNSKYAKCTDDLDNCTPNDIYKFKGLL